MSATFLNAAQRRETDAAALQRRSAVETPASAVWRELASEILSHLNAAALARAASTCHMYWRVLEMAVRTRIAHHDWHFDQPAMENGTCDMWHTQAGPHGCRCAWRRRTGWATVLHRVEMLDFEESLAANHGDSMAGARPDGVPRPVPQRAAGQHQPMPTTYGWSARSIIAMNPDRGGHTVCIDKPDDLDYVLGTSNVRETLRVWMVFERQAGTVALAELEYTDEQPPRATVMAPQGPQAVEQFMRQPLVDASSHTFVFAPNPQYDDEAILINVFPTAEDGHGWFRRFHPCDPRV